MRKTLLTIIIGLCLATTANAIDANDATNAVIGNDIRNGDGIHITVKSIMLSNTIYHYNTLDIYNRLDMSIIYSKSWTNYVYLHRKQKSSKYIGTALLATGFGIMSTALIAGAANDSRPLMISGSAIGGALMAGGVITIIY